MKEITAMKGLTRLFERNERFKNSLRSSIEHFRNGEDHLGLDDFLNSIDDLESIIDIYQCIGEPNVRIKKMLPNLQMMYRCMQNQDITGITDVLEFRVYPLSKEWISGCDEE
jgi:hypothetical protein